MNVVVTGGFGYIGSHLTQYLISQGHSVCVLARHIPQYLTDLGNSVVFHPVDITKPCEVILAQQYDIVVHLAAANDVDSKEPKNALDINVLGTKHVLDFCLKNNIKNFLYLSTFQVYGVESGIVDEKYPTHCKNDYAITHFFAEEYVRMYSRMYEMKHVTARPTNVYGCPIAKEVDRWTLVPANFCASAFKDGMITLLSSGNQHRDFISLENVSFTIDNIIKNFEIIQHTILNIASGKSITIMNVAQIVKEVYEERFNKTCMLEVKSNLPLESKELIVNTSRLESCGIKIPFQKEHMKKEIARIFDVLLR